VDRGYDPILINISFYIHILPSYSTVLLYSNEQYTVSDIREVQEIVAEAAAAAAAAGELSPSNSNR